MFKCASAFSNSYELDSYVHLRPHSPSLFSTFLSLELVFRQFLLQPKYFEGISNNTSNLQEDSDNSPPRRIHKTQQSDSDNSPPRDRHNRKQSDSDNSPNRVKTNSSLAKKTLDGKKAGLQNASSLKSEMDVLRGEEKRRLNALSSEISVNYQQERGSSISF